MSKNLPRVNLTLNPAGVGAPIYRTLKDTIEVVSLSLNSIDGADLSIVPESSGGGIGMLFGGPKRDHDERRHAYRSWLLGKAFQEFARGVRISLEEAYVYLSTSQLREKLQGKTTWGNLRAELDSIKTKAAHATFPVLLREVNKRLTEPLSFEKEFRSLNRLRNCLEHRHGIVGALDVDPGTDVLELALPCFIVVCSVDGSEVELSVGAHIEKDSEILIKRITRTLKYRLGERVSFTTEEFKAMGFACWFFAEDLMQKLPRLPALAA